MNWTEWSQPKVFFSFYSLHSSMPLWIFFQRGVRPHRCARGSRARRWGEVGTIRCAVRDVLHIPLEFRESGEEEAVWCDGTMPSQFGKVAWASAAGGPDTFLFFLRASLCLWRPPVSSLLLGLRWAIRPDEGTLASAAALVVKRNK